MADAEAERHVREVRQGGDAFVSAYRRLRFTCPGRRRSFLDRFRTGADAHRPDPGSLHTRQIEWAEFKGTRMTCRAATCVDCQHPIVNVVGPIWGVRMHDDTDSEEAWAKAVDAGDPEATR
jgi:hypothetical protein